MLFHTIPRAVFVSPAFKGCTSPVTANPHRDFADALFGWTEDDAGPKGQRAGRVSIGDASYKEARDGVWLHQQPIIPRALSSPKAKLS
jgi:hypothetical protein